MREYNENLNKAQLLIKNTKNTSETADELYELSKTVILASSKEYTYSDAYVFSFEINNITQELKEKIKKLEEAIDSIPEISDQVLGTIQTAQKIEYKITPITVSGGSNLVYSAKDVPADGDKREYDCGENGYNVRLVIQVYCGKNIMIYDGISKPYIPVQVKYYRKKYDLGDTTSYKKRNKQDRGLSYLKVTNENFELMTNNENNEWLFVREADYNYTASPENDHFYVSSNESVPFSHRLFNNLYASGSLVYTQVPKDTLTNVGKFSVAFHCQGTSCCTEQSIPGSVENYVVDVREYYKKMDEAKALLTDENMYKNTNAIYELSKLIINASKTEFTFADEKAFANEIDSLTNQLKDAIQKCK